MTCRIAVFARVPILGEVKTRLADAIGSEAALACYTGLLNIAIHAASSHTVELWFDREVESPWMNRNQTIKYQPNGDLGARMYAAFVDGVDIVIGSDIPLISISYVSQAVRMLEEMDVVLGPTEDGGYCLIGMNCPTAALFDGIAWSSPQVLEQTLVAARRLGQKVGLLPTLWDVDDEDDYRRWLST